MAIPVIDFDGVYSHSASNSIACCPQVQQLHSAFTTVGFVFIKNHGIDRTLIDQVSAVAAQFFSLPLDVKKRYIRHDDSGNNGYVCLEQEGLDPSKPADLKECYNICSLKSCQYPDKENPDFRKCITNFYENNIKVSLKILELMGHALDLPDPQFFVKTHQKQGLGHSENYTTMRLLYYPPLSSTSDDVKPGQLRCGEHVDYGSITLLFQDPNGGLQVKRSDGGYIDVPYMPEAVLVNLGALMQQWTSDKYLATPHRVLIPEDEVRLRMVRQSIAFFVHPDNNTVIECLDGSNKYPPITAKEDTDRRFNYY